MKLPSSELKLPKDSRARILYCTLQILNCLAHEPRSLGVSEIAGRLGLPVATIYRTLNALSQFSIVGKDKVTRRYSLSSSVFAFIHDLTANYGPVGKFSAVLRRESARTGLSLYVSALSGGHTYVVASSGTYGDSAILGAQAPVYASSAGKTLVAQQPRETWENFLPSAGSPRLTRFTNVDPTRFLLELEAAAKSGIAWNHRESAAGFVSVAAPVRELQGAARFAIAITLPEEELKHSDTGALERQVRQIARILEQK